MPGGRPPKFNNCLDLEAAIELFFEECVEKEERPTITKLALALGYNNRQSLYDNEKNDEFSGIIKRARLVVESHYEDMLAGKSPTGAIFALKNMGWADRQEVTGKDGGPIESKSTVEAGPGVLGVLSALGRATTARSEDSDAGGDSQ